MVTAAAAPPAATTTTTTTDVSYESTETSGSKLLAEVLDEIPVEDDHNSFSDESSSKSDSEVIDSVKDDNLSLKKNSDSLKDVSLKKVSVFIIIA